MFVYVKVMYQALTIICKITKFPTMRKASLQRQQCYD